MNHLLGQTNDLRYELAKAYVIEGKNFWHTVTENEDFVQLEGVITPESVELTRDHPNLRVNISTTFMLADHQAHTSMTTVCDKEPDLCSIPVNRALAEEVILKVRDALEHFRMFMEDSGASMTTEEYSFAYQCPPKPHASSSMLN